MKTTGPNYFPLARPFLSALFLTVLLIIAFIQVGIIGYAYEKMGISQHYVSVLLLLSLFGSYVNIPVAELPAKRVISGEEVTFFGVRYVIPRVQELQRTVIAVNMGGAVIPTLLSLYLMIKNGIYIQTLIGVIVLAVIVWWKSRPIQGIGIATPLFLPPLVAVAVALLLPGPSAPALAYVTGSLGTLIGADLLNLGKIQELNAPVASIGGAGTFDGIFLTGIFAVLLA